MSDPAPQREAILTALERLLAWPEISRSPQLGRFLDYIVRRTLDGDEQAIKAYSIAVDVFGRAVDFDPQADPIVRVQARRLRSLLDDYYLGSGMGELVRIQLPVGRYIPEFVAGRGGVAPPPASPPPAVARTRPARGRRLPPTWFVLAGIALLVALAAYALSAWGRGWKPSRWPRCCSDPALPLSSFKIWPARPASRHRWRGWPSNW
ncbi:hypothetical protein [Devosia sp. A369]